MKKIKFLLFVLLALLYVTNANALIVNDTFTRDGNTYRVTKMDEAHDGIPQKLTMWRLYHLLTLP